MVLTGTYCTESSSTISGQFSRPGYRVPVHDGIGKQMTWRNVKLQTEKSVSALPPTPAYDRKQTPMKDRTHRACGAYIINNLRLSCAVRVGSPCTAAVDAAMHRVK